MLPKEDQSIEVYLDFINKLYPEMSDRTARFAENAELTHALLGLSGETGEVVDLIKKHLAYGKDLDKAKLTLELGDLFHYFCRVVFLSGLSLDDVITGNYLKLQKRFPNGFTNKDAIEQTENKC